MRRYAVQQAPCGPGCAVVGWGVGARVGVRADVVCVNLCPRTHELHVRGLRVRGSLAAKSRSVGEVSGTRLCRGAWQTSHCTGSCRSAQGQPPGERQGISICERSRVPFMPDATVTHNNSWRSRQQAPPQYGNSHARDRSCVKRSRHPLSTHTASVALLCACSMPPRVVPAPLHPREPPVPAGGPRRHYARPAH